MPDTKPKQSILIVDDSLLNIKLMAGILSSEYRVVFAKDGMSALDLARKNRPDIILMDVLMPDMDGYSTVRLLKEDPITASIPVIFVTSLDDEKDEARGLELGAVDYITKPIKPSLMLARIANHLELKRHRDHLQSLVHERTLEIVSRLVQVAEARDTDTGDHVRRISEYSRILASKLDYSNQEVDLIAQASMMHDIGKVGIPDSILLKPGKLDAEEWKIMKTHSRIGHDNLKGSSSKLLKMASEIALTHHEKWDGTGYPGGLKETGIPLPGRIVCLVDVFDALTSKRPYKAPWPFEKAEDYIVQEKGTFFDPNLVDIFCQHKNEFFKIYKMFGEK